MPELPEVQTIVDDLIALGLIGRIVRGAAVFWSKTVACGNPQDFCRQIHSRKIIGIDRRAKFIRMFLDKGDCLAIHLRMTGRLMMTSPQTKPGKHVHVTIDLDDGRQLQYHDTRKFGRFYLLRDAQAFFKRLGPEPLAPTFTAEVLSSLIRSHNRQIKPLLLDQTIIAGLGNIYVDEALWGSRIHPQHRSNILQHEQIVSLHRAIRKVLRQGLKNAGTTLGDGKGNFYSLRNGRGRNATALNVFRREGKDCPRCRSTIERIVVGQRSTHLCPHCQPASL